MGVNVNKASVPPADMLQFPATSIEDELGKSMPAREDILLDILSAFLRWREKIDTDELVPTWERLLAFRGEQVQVTGEVPITGELMGLESDGSLLLRDANNNSVIIRYGDVSLRPAA
jgi:biotin-(acetyl-CoA carboxylase) ligase